MSASRSMPVSTPDSSSTCTRSSSARLPLAPGANGQPPRPPTVPSMRAAPASRAASALAMPSPRVSWRCTPTGTVDRRAASCRRRGDVTSRGMAVPMVSASDMPAGASGEARSATASTSPVATGRRTGTRTRWPASPRARRRRGSACGDGLHLGERGVGGAAGVVAAVAVGHAHHELQAVHPGGEGRWAPRAFSTSAHRSRRRRGRGGQLLARRPSPARGRGGRTSVSSRSRTPARTNASNTASLSAVATTASSCRPSRSVTSRSDGRRS